jgi:hypothetical protein
MILQEIKFKCTFLKASKLKALKLKAPRLKALKLKAPRLKAPIYKHLLKCNRHYTIKDRKFANKF